MIWLSLLRSVHHFGVIILQRFKSRFSYRKAIKENHKVSREVVIKTFGDLLKQLKEMNATLIQVESRLDQMVEEGGEV